MFAQGIKGIEDDIMLMQEMTCVVMCGNQMTTNGVMTSIYLQLDLLPAINKCIADQSEIYKSRNSFINGSVSRELRRLGFLPKEREE